jgi:pyridoxal phosphate enzyme (YggS family)
VESAPERLARVNEAIQAAARRSGRNPEDIALVAVTKTVSFDRVVPLLKAGVRFLGENRVQEAQSKYADRQAQRILPQVQLHLIGHLQTNKAKKAVELFDIVQSLDSVRLGDALNEGAKHLNKPMPCLVEVKISGEPAKEGLPPEQLNDFLAQAARWPFLKIRGLMGIAPYSDDAEAARPFFARLRRMFEASKLEILSMGMSGDFAVAIEEGSTMVRLGTALFGPRVRAGSAL